MNHRGSLGRRNLHRLNGLGGANRVILRHLGAPVQRFDQCRHAARVLDFVQEIQNREPVDSIFRVVEVRSGERTDDDIGDGLHFGAVSISAVRRKRFGVDLLEIEDRVLSANRIGKLTGLPLRVVLRGMTTQTERCNENCNRPPPVAHNHSEPPHGPFPHSLRRLT